MPAKHIVRFGAFEANLATGELRRDGVRVKVQEQPFQVLAALLERPGEIVSKDELQHRIWDDGTIVDYDRGLAVAVNRVRQALGDSANKPHYVETVPKRGYRFIYPLTQAEGGESRRDAYGPAVDSGRGSARRWLVTGAALLLALGSYAIWESIRPVRPGQPKSIAPLTHYPGAEIDPTFSPDGDRIAFAWDRGEGSRQLDIYVQIIGESNPRPLTETSLDEIAPAWSPDGRHIAFLRTQEDGLLNYQLVLIPATGGPETVIGTIQTHSPRLAWSPDSRYLFLSCRTGEGRTQAIYAVDRETRERVQITEPEMSTMDGSPAVSGDGRRLAFTRGKVWASELFEVPLRDSMRPIGAPVQLTSSDGASVERPVFWDDSILYEHRGYTDGFAEIRVLGDELVTLTPGNRPAVSMSRKRVAFADASQEVSLWQVRVDSQHRVVGEPRQLLESSGFEIFPEYSPDGTKIAFQSNRDGRSHIWISSSDGRGPKRLTSLGSDGSPSWSPDSDMIVFDSTDGGEFSIYVVNAEGGRPVLVTDLGYSPVWSHDDQRIYFTRTGAEGQQVWQVRQDGSDLAQVTTRGGARPQIVPGDRHIYYHRKDPVGVWRMPLDGGPEEPVLSAVTSAVNFHVVDGGIYYAEGAKRGDVSRLLFWDNTTKQSLPTGVSVPVVDGRTPRVGIAVSPDGNWLIYRRREFLESDIKLAEWTE